MRKWIQIIKDLKAELDTGIVKTRKVGSGNSAILIPYLEGDIVIQTANRIFGHDGWSVSPQGPVERFDVGTKMKGNKEIIIFTYTVPMLCEFHGLLEDGTVHTIRKGDIGKNSTQSEAYQQHEMAISGCATDALKRSMRHLGNQFGLTLYDKESEDFKAVMAAAKTGSGTTRRSTTTGKRRSTAQGKKKQSTKQTSRTSRKKAEPAKKKKKETTPKESPEEIQDEMWARAMEYVLPKKVKIDGQMVDVPEGGAKVEKVINSTIATDLFAWLAGIRSSPNDTPPLEPNNETEQSLQNALRYILSESELSTQLNDEELALVRGE